MAHQINLIKERAAAFMNVIDMLLARTYPRLPVINKDLSGKRAIVTGANSGMGFEIAKRLAELGAEVWVFCRTEEKGRAAAEELKALTRNSRIFYDAVDFSKLKEVREVVDRWAQKPESDRSVDILINNAGLTVSAKRTTEDGFELTYGVNLLSQFLLTTSFLNRSIMAPDARIVQVSSGSLYICGPCNPDDLNSTDMLGKLKENESFGGNWLLPYGRSKAQQVVFTRMLQEKLGRSERYKDVVVSACHPGCIWTPIWNSETSKAGRSEEDRGSLKFIQRISSRPEEGAKNALYMALAEAPTKPHLRGKYWDRCRTKWTPAWMEDEGLRNRLWARWEEDANVEASRF